MARFHGKHGQVTYTSGGGDVIPLGNATSWTLDVKRDEDDATVLDTTNDWKVFVFGHGEATGTIEGYLDDTALWTPSSLQSQVVGLKLTDGSGTVTTLDAQITGASMTNDRFATGKYSATFRMLGAPTSVV